MRELNKTLLKEYRMATTERKAEIEEMMLVNNRGLIESYLKRNRMFDDDNFQAGYIGLLEAVRKFKPEMDTSFSTYAIWWIKKCVHRQFEETGTFIRIPTNQHGKVPLFSVGSDEITLKGGEKGSLVDLVEVAEINNLEGRDIVKGIVKNFLDTIGDRDRKVFTLRYFEDIKLEDIGEMIGVTKERVRQILVRLEEKFRRLIRAESRKLGLDILNAI